jgi:hypothetical protein
MNIKLEKFKMNRETAIEIITSSLESLARLRAWSLSQTLRTDPINIDTFNSKTKDLRRVLLFQRDFEYLLRGDPEQIPGKLVRLFKDNEGLVRDGLPQIPIEDVVKALDP